MRLPDFIMGICLALIYMNSNKNHPFGIKLNMKQATAIEITSILLVVLGIFTALLMPQTIRFSMWMVPLLAFLVLVFSYQLGYVSKLLNNKIMVFLGEVSFSFYMVHLLVLMYISKISISSWGVIVLSFVIAIVLSCVVFVAYEEPSRLKLKKILENKFLNQKDRPKLNGIGRQVFSGVYSLVVWVTLRK